MSLLGGLAAITLIIVSMFIFLYGIVFYSQDKLSTTLFIVTMVFGFASLIFGCRWAYIEQDIAN